jgi:hypothetical protein
MLKSWQGVPPTRTSIDPWSPASMVVKSPCSGVSGWRCLSTARGNASISERKAARQPSGPQATDAASMPEQTLPKITARAA